MRERADSEAWRHLVTNVFNVSPDFSATPDAREGHRNDNESGCQILMIPPAWQLGPYPGMKLAGGSLRDALGRQRVDRTAGFYPYAFALMLKPQASIGLSSTCSSVSFFLLPKVFTIKARSQD
jgi:hypothetical protein